VAVKRLPFRTETGTGDRFDFEFPLHPATQSPMRVSQLAASLLKVLDADIAVASDVGNGDVLQALAIALAIRARMIHVDRAVTDALVDELVRSALAAARAAERHAPPAGRA